MSPILPLSSEAVSQIQASKQINSLHGVVLALLENSLDAGSSRIELTVDFRRRGCIVQDNGRGISPAEFAENGGLGRLYHTSKRGRPDSHQLHGRNGIFLAALAALSLLTISSCGADRGPRAILTVHQGKTVRRHVSASPHETSDSITRGTCVSVRDLFGNMPVRVKHYALNADTDGDYERSWHELKLAIVALLLASSKPCSVRMREEGKENTLLLSSGVHPTISAALTEKNLGNLAGLRSKFDLNDALPLLCQAGLTSHELKSNWIPVSAKTSGISLKGSIRMVPAPTKQCQFVSIGVQPCLQSDGYAELYDAVNKTFANSSFGSVGDESEMDEDNGCGERERRFKSIDYTQKQLHTRKGVDRWPMFIMQIHFTDENARCADLGSMGDYNFRAIIDILETTVMQWLSAHHFRPRRRRQARNHDQVAPTRASTSGERSCITTGSPHSPGTSTAITPNAEKAFAFQSAGNPKKRKLLDVEGNNRGPQRKEEVMRNVPKDYFHSWSRIKSGKGSFYNNVWDAKKPATTPAGQIGTKTSDRSPRLEGFSTLLTVDVGALNTTTGLTKTSVEDPVLSDHAGKLESVDLNASSEDYGSFDEDEIRAVLETANSDTAQRTSVHGMLEEEPRGWAAEGCEPTDELIEWQDPVSKQILHINARTGHVLSSVTVPQTSGGRANVDCGLDVGNAAAVDMSLSSAGIPISLARRFKSSKENELHWLPGFLRDWKNPVFARQTEERISVAHRGGFGAELAERAAERCTHGERTNASAEAGVSTSKMTKAALRYARVIGQVDRKYILCSVINIDGGNKGNTLIMIDQHAASERIILERLFVELCSFAQDGHQRPPNHTHSIPVDKSLHFDVSEADFQRFKKHKQHFVRWGIVYEMTEKEEAITASQVRDPKRVYILIVRGLPSAIAERCMLVPKLLIEMLRSEIWTMEDRLQPQRTEMSFDADRECDDGDEHGWLKHIGSCPRGVIEMLNSRACRSAIMFNDELSVAQCEQLLADLSKCAFPFVCAHGRISTAPIADLGREGEEAHSFKLSSGDGGWKQNFTGAFKQWKIGDRRVDREEE